MVLGKNVFKSRKGEWIEGIQNGFGINTSFINDRKTIYSGHWQNGKRHGKGHIEYSDGSIIEGQFDNGRKVGSFNIQRSTGIFQHLKKKFRNMGHMLRFIIWSDLIYGPISEKCLVGNYSLISLDYSGRTLYHRMGMSL